MKFFHEEIHGAYNTDSDSVCGLVMQFCNISSVATEPSWWFVKPSRATVVSVDDTTSVARPSFTPDNGQASTGTICSDGSQINTCEDGWTLVKSKPQKYNSNFVGITSVPLGKHFSKMQET